MKLENANNNAKEIISNYVIAKERLNELKKIILWVKENKTELRSYIDNIKYFNSFKTVVERNSYKIQLAMLQLQLIEEIKKFENLETEIKEL